MIESILLLSLAAVVIVGVHAVAFAPVDLRKEAIDVVIDGLDPAFDGYTLAVMADVHHSSTARLSYLRRVIAWVNEASPDLVVLLGDLGISFKHQRALSVRLYRAMLIRAGAVLRQISARDGVLAVLGNHEYYADPAAVVDALTAIGIRVLINDCVIVHRRAGQLAVGGVDDFTEGEVDSAGGCADVPEDVPRVIISHSPDAVLALARDARVDLMLAGHTHGGQIVLPLYGAPVTRSRVCGRRSASGWIPEARVRLYVSRGIGCQIPIRFRCPPELVFVRLRAPTPTQQTA